MTTVDLVKASHAMEELIVQLQQAEQERDEARRHLQSALDAWSVNDEPALADAMALADIYLKGGI